MKLEVAKRTGSAAAAREAGMVPAVVYGPKQEPISITVEKVLFTKTLEEAGESTILTLVGLDEELEVLIHDVAFNPAKGGVDHADFYAIERGKELTTNVALEFIGEAPATKLGAVLNKALHEVEVTCRPSDLPSHIDVDVTGMMDVEAYIAVKDLVVPAGVKVENDPELMVVTITPARAEEPETVETVDMGAIEVEKKGKKEEAD